MKLLRLLAGRFPVRFAFAVLLGVLSGGTATGLLVVIGRGLAGSPSRIAVPFVALALGRVVAAALAAFALHGLTREVLVDIRLRLGRAVLAAPLAHLEKVGTPRITAALTDDVGTLGRAALAWVDVVVQTATVVGSIAYLAMASWLAAAIVVGVVGVAWFFTRRLFQKGVEIREKAHMARARMFRGFQDAAKGTKELKLHRARRKAFLEALVPNIHETHDGLRRSIHVNAIGTALDRAAFFLAAGLAIAVLARPDAGTGFLTAAASAVLFMQAPLEGLLYRLEHLQEGGVAMRELDKVGLDLAASAEPIDAPTEKPRRFESLALVGVTHRYGGPGARDFTVGPIDLRLRPGEVTFIVGGNGSGKSTLGKVLLGLYPPDEGKIEVDGAAVDFKAPASYRELFAAIFADGHLFSELDAPGGDAQKAAAPWLDTLRMNEKVSVEDGAFSTTALSTGQRKRLALVAALVEDRPAYFFDEWAAEQDPELRDHFYKTILPELKARGKAVVVVSHDDRYFGTADRVLKLEDGRAVVSATESAA